MTVTPGSSPDLPSEEEIREVFERFKPASTEWSLSDLWAGGPSDQVPVATYTRLSNSSKALPVMD